MIKIITIYNSAYGYGAQLQASATARFCQFQKLQCEQISFKKSNSIYKTQTLVQKIFSLPICLIVRKVFVRLMTYFFSPLLASRRHSINVFSLSIPHSNSIFSYETIADTVKDNDIFIAGSDQIWNPAWTEDAYFLNFVPDHNGKIAYAASIGANEVKQDFLEHVVPYLRRFDFISVREESAKEILQPYLDQEIKVTLDPTLLLPREEWDKIAVQPTIPQPYIFVYLLGEKRAHRRLIKKFARTLGLKIAFLPHVHFHFNPADCFFADYNLYDVGPAEFVGLVKNAEIVITDSFHGCVFSIIYGRKFWALKRHKDSDPQNMNSRLYTLFDSLGLGDRLIENEDACYDANFLDKPIDYDGVTAKLNAQRKESADFLLNAIKTVQTRMRKENQYTEEKSR